MELENKNNTTSIQHVDAIIADIEDHIKNKQDFVAFILIALGIEFLGSFYDDKKFEDFGQSESRFKNSISNLFKNEWYKKNSNWLFQVFRGPLIHQYRTGDQILLTSNCKNNAPLSDHLELIGEKRIFILEQLFEDFKQAANKLKNIAQNETQNKIKPDKINQDYLSIYTIKNTTISYDSTIKSDVESYNSSGTIKMPDNIQFTPINDQTQKRNINLTPSKKKRKKK